MNKDLKDLIEAFVNIVVAIVLFSLAIQLLFIDGSVFSDSFKISMTIFSLAYACFAYRDKIKEICFKDYG